MSLFQPAQLQVQVQLLVLAWWPSHETGLSAAPAQAAGSLRARCWAARSPEAQPRMAHQDHPAPVKKQHEGA